VLALNRYIQALKIDLDFHFGGVDSDEDESDDGINVDEKDKIDSFIKLIFVVLLPLFRFNNIIQFFDLVVCKWDSRVFASGVNDMILASQSLKSIRLHFKLDRKILTGSALVKRQLQHLSLTVVEKLALASKICSQMSSGVCSH
jgi:hypothetical protein